MYIFIGMIVVVIDFTVCTTNMDCLRRIFPISKFFFETALSKLIISIPEAKIALTICVGVSVDQTGSIFNFAVLFGDLTADRAIDFTGGFYTFQGATFITLFEGSAGFWQLGKDNITQGFLGVFGNTHRGGGAINGNPFMFFGITAF